MPENIPFIQSYHARTRHHFEAYAAGPGQLDWDAQPAPFRHFHGAPCLSLPLSADQFERPWHDPAPTAAVPAGLDSIGAVLELSFGLSAWKSWGPSRWALRCNPSSGNLHPTESYLLCRGIPGLADGVHHYDPLQHQLESRALLNPGGSPCLLLGLSSIMWREAWKYGERAFRYCQLDLGHALGAIAYAAQLLGWQARPLALGSERLAKLLGLNRSEDFPSTPYPFTEAEEPEILLALQAPGLPPPSPGQLQALEAELQAAPWQGQASLIDPDPGYRWPLIDQAAQASRLPDDWLASLPASHPDPLPPLPAPDPDAANTPGHAALIRQRRSGQRYNQRLPLAKDAFYRMLDALLPRPETAPWPVLPSAARVHLLLFVERVEGLPPGLYLLPRSPAGAEALRRDIAPDDGRFTGQAAVARHDPDCPPHLGLICLAPLELSELQRLARALSCHQDIAATGAFTLGFLARMEEALALGADHYRHLLREAGLLGQILYLEAEAAGVRGTGIGCFFDTAVTRVLGIEESGWQSLYHFTVGHLVPDSRIETGPPYPDRSP